MVDEASMVDLSMMASLISALPATARVIFLGDRDQLASVEAGAVLGDICRCAEYGYSPQRARELAQLTGRSSPGRRYRMRHGSVIVCVCYNRATGLLPDQGLGNWLQR